MTEHEPSEGTVADRFRVHDRIGSGGFATVWRATDEETGDDVAVKLPRTVDNDSNDPAEIRSRFHSEYDVLDRFNSGLLPTSIVRYVDGSRTEPKYLAFEHVDGTGLTERLTEGSIEPGIEAARRFGFPVVRALEFLHRNGLCYLDCKPDNVLVRERDDSPVLIDFNTVEPISAAETLFYEDKYKAPEQTPTDDRATGPGTWSDVYAAGKLLWYLLTGETMSTTDTPTDGVDASEHGVTAPAAVVRVVRRATSADPDQRPIDARALLTALYRGCDRNAESAELVLEGGDIRCPIRPGETVGRVTGTRELPDVGVHDEHRYVSPVQFAVERDDDSWLVRDRSVNGTYLAAGDDWHRLLSEEGEQRLRQKTTDLSLDEQVYRAGRIHGQTVIAPVDPSYLRLTVNLDRNSARR